MRFKSFRLLITLALGIIIGAFLIAFASFTNYITWQPPKTDSRFIQACSELNGKEFTYQNISNLHGRCYDSGLVRACTEKDIANYLNEFKSGKLEGKDYTKFDISEGGLDATWRCALQPDQNNKIKAIPYFAYD